MRSKVSKKNRLVVLHSYYIPNTNIYELIRSGKILYIRTHEWIGIIN